MSETQLRVLENFSTVELKKSFFSGLLYVAKSDGLIHDSERSLLEGYAENLGFDIDFNDFNDFNIKSVKFLSKTQEECFVSEALKLSLIDGDYDSRERNSIIEITENFGWSLNNFEELESDLKSYRWLKKTETIELD